MLKIILLVLLILLTFYLIRFHLFKKIVSKGGRPPKHLLDTQMDDVAVFSAKYYYSRIPTRKECYDDFLNNNYYYAPKNGGIF